MEYKAGCLESSGEAAVGGEAAAWCEDPPFLQMVKM